MRVGTRIKELCAALEGMGSATAADTRRKIQAMGLWPKGLPVPDD